jgi:hypothetical protein
VSWESRFTAVGTCCSAANGVMLNPGRVYLRPPRPEQVAGKAAGRGFGRPDPSNGARGPIIKSAITHQASRIEHAPGYHPVGAHMTADYVAAGGPIRHRKVRLAASHRDTDQPGSNRVGST